MTESMLSISEAAKLMGVCENTLRDWDIEGKFEASRTTGGHRRYSLDQVREYLTANEPKAKSEPNDFIPAFANGSKLVEKWMALGYLVLDQDKTDTKVLAILLENSQITWGSTLNTVLSTQQALWLTHQGWLRA